jgi:hypothetical protein
MTSEKILARLSNGWYIWAAASTVVIVADMVLHGVTNLNLFAAMLSIAFAVLMFSGKRAEDFVIARYQERPPLVGSTAIPLATRVSILQLLGKGLWALWFVLLSASLAFPLAGDLNMSKALTEGLIGLALATIPLRVFMAAALFR